MRRYSAFAPHLRGSATAHAAVYRAIRRGRLLPAKAFSCADCPRLATEYDHRDYGKPLEVDPVCHGCNLARGPAKPRAVSDEELHGYVTSAEFSRKLEYHCISGRAYGDPWLSIPDDDRPKALRLFLGCPDQPPHQPGATAKGPELAQKHPELVPPQQPETEAA